MTTAGTKGIKFSMSGGVLVLAVLLCHGVTHAKKLHPIVLWHGMGDSCCDKNVGIGTLKESLEKEYGVFVYSIGFGSGAEDVKNSFFGNVNDQVSQVCHKLAGIKELKAGFDMIGFSQGGQFSRAVVERCQQFLPPIRYLITMGAQHQGIMNIPSCKPGAGPWCKLMKFIVGKGAYWPWAASHVIQAQYVKDPNNMDAYLAHNIFLPDVNNEKSKKNSAYTENLSKLDKFIMFRFRDDTVVEPRDSAWFSFFDGTSLIPLHDQLIYQEDWIGLRQLDEKGAIIFDECPSAHMHFTWEWFNEKIVEKYLNKKSIT